MLLAAASAVLVAGCATVNQADLDAWKGAPVEALDTHSFFLTLPMHRTVSASGIEIRNYVNLREASDCGATRVGSTLLATCTATQIGCNNLFYIKDGRVLEYAPRGRCKTAAFLRPEARYLELQKR
jgi:hypothetical protein